MVDVFSLLQEKEPKRKEAYDKLSLGVNTEVTDKNAWEQKLEDIKTQKK